ncbi:MAG: hypothetical protein QQN41_07575, partial [Nitrosopumilus sp.]
MTTVTKKSNSKLAAARKQAVISKKTIKSVTDGIYDGTDKLKHYIRKYYWEKRIIDLKRDISPSLKDGIKYFSFCSKYALDVRYFIRKNLINFNKSYSKFGFVEVVKEDYDILLDWMAHKQYKATNGIFGLLSEVATDTSHENYAKFWSSFRSDIINLDYLGDILRVRNPAGKINHNDSFA